MEGTRDCHITPAWLLLYRIENYIIVLPGTLCTMIFSRHRQHRPQTKERLILLVLHNLVHDAPGLGLLGGHEVVAVGVVGDGVVAVLLDGALLL